MLKCMFSLVLLAVVIMTIFYWLFGKAAPYHLRAVGDVARDTIRQAEPPAIQHKAQQYQNQAERP